VAGHLPRPTRRTALAAGVFWADDDNPDEVARTLDTLARLYGLDRSQMSAEPIGPTPEEELLPDEDN